MRKALRWTPRVLGILFIVFLSLFALDAFALEGTVLYKLGAFFIHLIPTFLLVIVLLVAWRHPLAGGTIFLVVSLLFTIFFKTYRFLVCFLSLSVPLILVGALFIISHFVEQNASSIKG